jgi:methylmalonyl-CoA mutase N-terminal domain/subunit
MIEYLTDEIETHAGEYLKKIEAMGGALKAIEAGYIQNEIQESAYKFQQALEKKEEIVVGVNAFKVDEKIELERLKVNPEIEEGQCQRLQQLRENRDAEKVNELMQKLETTSKGNDNLMPLIIECVENKITLGEICTVLREAWGQYQPSSWV